MGLKELNHKNYSTEHFNLQNIEKENAQGGTI